MDDITAVSESGRRHFLETTVMAGGLVAGYGTFAALAAKFLHADDTGSLGWQFLCVANELATGESFTYVSPAGAKVVVTRQQAGDNATDFIALSSVCPHLGCKVHWEKQNNRYFCPCHNGAFDAQGRATAGPPADAKQSLAQFPLKIEGGLLFIQVPLQSLVANESHLADAVTGKAIQPGGILG